MNTPGTLLELIETLVQLVARLCGYTHHPVEGPPPLTPIPDHPYEPPWLTLAFKEIGFQERGHNLGIERYCEAGKCGEPGQPWCAIFTNAMLETANERGTRSAMARSYESSPYYERLPGPAYGCITTMWRGSSGGGSGHVFFYVGENENGIVALGGNQRDGVRLQLEPRERVTGYWWPKSHPVHPRTFDPIVRKDINEIGSEA